MKKPLIALFAFTALLLTGCSDSAESNGGNTPELASNANAEQARDLCVNHGGGISMHIHPQLTIFITGEQVPLPANIGITDECMKAVHTHDSSGKIHLEYPTRHEFRLADLFANWGQAFTKDQILDSYADFARQVTMTTNGRESSAFENLGLVDLQEIVIRYE